MSFEVWMLSFAPVGDFPRLARQAERHGWDGLLAADSQNLTGDPYAAMAVAATQTDRVRLGTGVTNPVTRHPAVTASAVATVQLYSGGRAVLGIGRGDSAVSQLGQRPAALAAFETYLRRVQRYLSGEAADLDGFVSRMPWVAEVGLPKVPVDVAATGPRAIGVGARVADRLSFTVGADPSRLRWAIDTARKARVDAGLDPDGISLGAYVNAVSHPDPQVARELVRGSLGVFARFSGMQPGSGVGLAARDRDVVEAVTASYEIDSHARRDAGYAKALSEDFVERFAVIGPPEYCVGRLGELTELGLDHLVIASHSRDADPALLAEASEVFGQQVIPALRSRRPAGGRQGDG